MATAAQIEANRRNATKSTGPKTPEGKAKSARNATKHGLTAQHIVLSTEDQEQYDAHREQMLAELAPSGHTETMLAERIVSLSWRLDRAARIQTEALDAILANKDLASDDLALGRAAIWDCRNDRILDRLVLYERRIENSLHKSLRELNRLQTARRNAAKEKTTQQSHVEPARSASRAPHAFADMQNAQNKPDANIGKMCPTDDDQHTYAEKEDLSLLLPPNKRNRPYRTVVRSY